MRNWQWPRLDSYGLISAASQHKIKKRPGSQTRSFSFQKCLNLEQLLCKQPEGQQGSCKEQQRRRFRRANRSDRSNRQAVGIRSARVKVAEAISARRR